MQRTFQSKNLQEKFEDVGLNRKRIWKWFSRVLLMGLNWLRPGFIGGILNSVVTCHFP